MLPVGAGTLPVGPHCSVLKPIPSGSLPQVPLQGQEELHVKLSLKDMLYNIHHPGNLGGGVTPTVLERIPTAQGCR